MRLRFWLGFAVVAAIAIGSVALALIVHEREVDSFEHSAARRGDPRRPPGRSAGGALGRPARQRRRLLPGRGTVSAATSSTSSPTRCSTPAALAGDRLRRLGAACAAGARFERDRGYPILERSPLGDFRPAPATARTTSRWSSRPRNADLAVQTAVRLRHRRRTCLRVTYLLRGPRQRADRRRHR